MNANNNIWTIALKQFAVLFLLCLVLTATSSPVEQTLAPTTCTAFTDDLAGLVDTCGR